MFANGTIITVAGSGETGYSPFHLNAPRGLAVDAVSGDVYIADSGNHAVRLLPKGQRGAAMITVAGTGSYGISPDGGLANATGLSGPAGVAINGSGAARLLIIAEAGNHRIRRVDLASGRIATVAGDGSQGYTGDGRLAIAAQLNEPAQVRVLGSDLLVADKGNNAIRAVNASGHIRTVVAGFDAPSDAVARLGRTASAASSVALPDLLVCDRCTVTSFSAMPVSGGGFGVVSPFAGAGFCGYASDGEGVTSRVLAWPTAIDVDPLDGSVSIAESESGLIRRVVNLALSMRVTSATAIVDDDSCFTGGSGGSGLGGSGPGPCSSVVSTWRSHAHPLTLLMVQGSCFSHGRQQPSSASTPAMPLTSQPVTTSLRIQGRGCGFYLLAPVVLQPGVYPARAAASQTSVSPLFAAAHRQ